MSHSPVVPAALGFPSSMGDLSLEDAREAFLVELATFQLALKKSAMICDAEARQVEEYQHERQQIDHEHGVLRTQIEQLKVALEEAQLVRRRKIEYDLVAEKVNTLPSREEFELSIESLEADIMTIRSEHEHQSRTLYDQKSSLDEIIARLDYLRFMGKDKDGISVAPSPTSTPLPEDVEEAAEADPSAVDSTRDNDKDEGVDKPSLENSPVAEAAGDDIEMGEVEEDPKDGRLKKKQREELEEGEASDASSVLSDPPDD